MITYRRYDRRIQSIADRRRTLRQICHELEKARLPGEDLIDPIEVEIRCEVLTRMCHMVRHNGPLHTSYELAARQGTTRPTHRPWRVLPRSVAAGALTVLAGCATQGGSFLSSDEDLAPRYHAERVPNLAGIYQEPGQRVYRFCRGAECLPTPKVLRPDAHAGPVASTSYASSQGLPPLPPSATAAARFVPPTAQQKASLDALPSQPIERVAVFFDFASAKLNQAALETLKEHVAPIKKARKIVLVGRTDSVGSKASNETFARQRATALKNTLVALGVNEALIQIEADPQTTAPLHPDARSSAKPADPRAIARRVDVTLF